MASWVTDRDMYHAARGLGDKLIEMFHKADVPLPYPGADMKDPHYVIYSSLVADAEDYMSLDPQKITDEYLRIQKAAIDINDGSAYDDLQTAHAQVVNNWSGDAAREFANQLMRIHVFMEKQQERTLVAAQAMGTALSLTIRLRESYRSLAENTIAACQKVIDDHSDGETSAMIAIGTSIVSAGIDVLTMEKVKELVKWSVDQFVELAGGTAQKVAIDDNDAIPVVDSYARARDQLRRSYEDGLNQLRDWVNQQDSILSGEKLELLEPLPAYCDIDSPDFSYENFYSENHDPSSYTPKVEQERRKNVGEKQQHPNGVIQQRLRGGE